MDLASRLAGIAPAFTYDNGELHASGVNLAEIAAAAGGPVYVYDLDAILSGYREFEDAFEGQPTRICYAMKANDSIGVIKALAAAGAVCAPAAAADISASAPAAAAVAAAASATAALRRRRHSAICVLSFVPPCPIARRLPQSGQSAI